MTCPRPEEELQAASKTAGVIMRARRDPALFAAIRDGWYRGCLRRVPGAAIKGAREGFLSRALMDDDPIIPMHADFNGHVKATADATDWAAVVVGLDLRMD